MQTMNIQVYLSVYLTRKCDFDLIIFSILNVTDGHTKPSKPPLVIIYLTHLRLQASPSARKNSMDKYVKFVFFLALWFCFSISLSVLNKFLFGIHHTDLLLTPAPSNTTFVANSTALAATNVTSYSSTVNLQSLPLLTTAWHQCIHFLLSLTTLFLIARFQRLSDSDHEQYRALDDNAPTSAKQRLLKFPPTRVYWTTLVPCGLATSLDIGLSNTSMRYISLSLYTMLKSTTPIFVVLVAWFMRLEKVTWRLVAVVCVMCVGVVLMVSSPKDSVSGSKVSDRGEYILGVVLVLLASVMSGVRWGLTQLWLHSTIQPHEHDEQQEISLESMTTASASATVFALDSDGGMSEDDLDLKQERAKSSALELQENTNRATQSHPFPHLHTMFLLSPVMCLSLLILSISIEHPFSPTQLYTNIQHTSTAVTFLWMSAGGCLAFMMVLSELLLVSMTSAITLSVAGMGKETLTIIMAMLVFGDKMTAVSAVGVVITMLAIGYYQYYKRRKQEIDGHH